MTATQEKTAGNDKNAIPSGELEPRSSKIDRNAPAGSENSLLAQRACAMGVQQPTTVRLKRSTKKARG